MFTTEDITEITRLFPPNELLGTGPSNDLPLLSTSLSGDYLLTRDSILREFEELVRSVTQRIAVSSVSQYLDVDEKAIQKVVRDSPHLALISTDERHIITKNERDTLWQKIRETAAHRLVDLNTFAQDESISTESANALALSSFDGSEQPNDLVFESDRLQSRFVTSSSYGNELKSHLRGLLEEAGRKVEPLTVSSHGLPGSPPLWYVMKMINTHLKAMGKQLDWKIQKESEKVECIPLELLSQRQDEEFRRLAQGSIPYIDIHLFAKEYRDIYPSDKLAIYHFITKAASAHLSVLGTVALSKEYLDRFVENRLKEMHETGFVDVATDIRNTFPASCQDQVLFDVKKAFSLHENGKGFQIYPMGKYILSQDCYEKLRIAANSQAREQARTLWEKLKDSPEKDCQFQVSSEGSRITDGSSDDRLKAIHEETSKIFAKEAEKEYWDEISNLELKNEEEFAEFWMERVESRACVYTQGLKGVEDAKLQSQLSELLCTYLLKEVIPDSLARARAQGLIRSRKTRKNIKKLESILGQGPMDLSTVVSAIRKFGKKQAISGLEENAISESMKTQVNDMIRKMHKQANGPLLFLTLVIVLLAKHQHRLVYATGKFAPKLMKQLKPSMKPEDYEQLEKWKDLAKAGTLTNEDKEQMRAMAGGE